MDFLHIIDELNYLIEHSAAQWWVIPLVSLFCLIDGFFLFLPSETAIVALAAIAARSGEPNIWLLILGTSIGAIIGDNIAFYMGRKLGTTRFRWMRRPRGAKAFAWAAKELEKRGAILIFTARYIPVGRIAVNFTAGATYFPWRRFAIIDSIAVVTWAGYSVAVGTFAGRWIHDNPLLGVGIAITFAIVIGFIVDHSMKYLHHVLEKRGRIAPRPEPGLVAANHAARVEADTARMPGTFPGEPSDGESGDGGEDTPAAAQAAAQGGAIGAPVANAGEAPKAVPDVELSTEIPAEPGAIHHDGQHPVPLLAAVSGHAAGSHGAHKLAQHETHP